MGVFGAGKVGRRYFAFEYIPRFSLSLSLSLSLSPPPPLIPFQNTHSDKPEECVGGDCKPIFSLFSEPTTQPKFVFLTCLVALSWNFDILRGNIQTLKKRKGKTQKKEEERETYFDSVFFFFFGGGERERENLYEEDRSRKEVKEWKKEGEKGLEGGRVNV